MIVGDSKLKDISSIDINDLNNNVWISFTVIVKKDNRSEEDMKKIADTMAKWYKNHNIYGSTNFILLNSKEYESVNEDNYLSVKELYNVSNLVSCTIKDNGDVEIE